MGIDGGYGWVRIDLFGVGGSFELSAILFKSLWTVYPGNAQRYTTSVSSRTKIFTIGKLTNLLLGNMFPQLEIWEFAFQYRGVTETLRRSIFYGCKLGRQALK